MEDKNGEKEEFIVVRKEDFQLIINRIDDLLNKLRDEKPLVQFS